MNGIHYIMESDEETLRLEMKTKSAVIRKQALWAGIKKGMRVADIGCGSGKTTSILYKLVQPGGIVVGVDGSEKRIKYAKEHYAHHGIEFLCKDIREPFRNLELFDFVWVRFILEYYRSSSFDIVQNISKIVKPGGILCLIDLDHNSLNYFGLSQKLERTILTVMKIIEESANFDPYIGRKLYSYLYKLGYQNIDMQVTAHHLIFGELKKTDAFNWIKKIKTVSQKIHFKYDEYEGGYEEFFEEFERFLNNPGRFIYTPVISSRGIKL